MILTNEIRKFALYELTKRYIINNVIIADPSIAIELGSKVTYVTSVDIDNNDKRMKIFLSNKTFFKFKKASGVKTRIKMVITKTGSKTR